MTNAWTVEGQTAAGMSDKALALRAFILTLVLRNPKAPDYADARAALAETAAEANKRWAHDESRNP